MKRVVYFTSPQKDLLIESIPAFKWSAGMCLTQDKTIAKDLASNQDRYIYKCLLNESAIQKINSKVSIPGFKRRENMKAQGVMGLKICNNFIYIPTVNSLVESVQYLVFNPSVIEIVDTQPLKRTLKESLDTHSKLNSKLFDANQILKEDVRQRLIEIADNFIADFISQGIPLKVYDYWLVGSNAAYNYQVDSDIDLHLIIDSSDIEADPKIIRLLFDYAKAAITKNYDIAVKGHPVEIYLEDGGSSAASNGVYSIKNNRWIKIPKPLEDATVHPEKTQEFEDLLSEYYRLEDDEIEAFIDKLYMIRKESLASEGEFGLGNLIFKEFRNTGRLSDLKERLYQHKSSKLTLESLNEWLLCEASLTKITNKLKNIFQGLYPKVVDFRVDQTKHHVIVTTQQADYCIPIEELSHYTTDDYEKLRFYGNCQVADGYMPNPQGDSPNMVPVYYGIPYRHLHIKYDDEVTVYRLEKDRVINEPISLNEFIQGIQSGGY